MRVSQTVQDALTTAGGKNYRGEPNFRFEWSPNFTYNISNGKAYEPFRVCAEDCWLLLKWEDVDFWGSEADWELTNWEPGGPLVATANESIVTYAPLYTAGPYPKEGRYRMIRTLKKAVVKDGVLTFEHPEPTLAFVDQVFPLLRDFLELTTEQKAELIRGRDTAEKAKLAKDFGASRELYRGIATAKQIKTQTEKIERFLDDPLRVKQALQLTKRRTT